MTMLASEYQPERSSDKPIAADEQTLQIMRRLDGWHVEHPDLGHRRLVVLLNQNGSTFREFRITKISPDSDNLTWLLLFSKIFVILFGYIIDPYSNRPIVQVPLNTQISR